MLWSVSSTWRGIWRARGLLLAVCLVLASARAQPSGVAGTLPEDYFPVLRAALENALRQSPQLIERQLEIALQESRLDTADAPRWPRVSGLFDYASSQAAISGNTSTTNRDQGLFYRLELTQPLFHWGALKNDSARARIQVAIAEKNYLEQYRILANGLRQTYLLLVAKKADLQQARARQRLREATLELARDKYARGVVAESEVAGALLAVRENALQLERSELEFATLRRGFARTAGMTDLREEDVATDVPEVTYSPELTSTLLAALLRQRAQSSFAVQVYELQAREADLAYRVARVRQLPKFYASAGHYVENTTNATAFTVDQRGVERQAFGVRAEWSIFDGFATRGAKREALSARRLAERRLANAAEQVMEEAQRLQRLLQLEAEVVKFADEHRGLAEAGLSRVKDEVERGNLPPSRTEQAQAEVYGRVAASALARSNLLIKWSDFVSLTGADPLLKTIAARHAREKR